MKRALPLAALGLAVAAPANAAAFMNGSFESASVNPGSGFLTLGAGDTSITGWVVGGHSIDYIGGYWQPQNGQRSIDLAGNSNGSIAQTFTTSNGTTYRVNYYIARNPDGGITPRTGSFAAGSTTGTFAYGDLTSTRSNMKWLKQTFTFTAGGPSTTLSFAADPLTSGGAYGPALDNVSVAAIPEPAQWMLLISGFGLVGATMRRRARKLAVG